MNRFVLAAAALALSTGLASAQVASPSVGSPSLNGEGGPPANSPDSNGTLDLGATSSVRPLYGNEGVTDQGTQGITGDNQGVIGGRGVVGGTQAPGTIVDQPSLNDPTRTF